jgi:hypothetical protein
MIVKTSKGWEVRSLSGKSLGTYKSKKEAEERLRQVEMFKHIKTENRSKKSTPLYSHKQGCIRMRQI